MIAPSFHQIPIRITFGAFTGFLLAKIAGSSPRLWVKVAVISSLADSILFLGIVQITGEKISRKMTHLLIHALVSIIEIIALRRLDLLAHNGTLVIGAYAVARCFVLAVLKADYFKEPLPRMQFDGQLSKVREPSRKDRNSPATSPRVM